MITPVPISRVRGPFPSGAALFRSCLPVTGGSRKVLDAAITAGVGAVVMLLPPEEAEKRSGVALDRLYLDLGWKLLLVPVVDGGAWSQEQLVPAIGAVERWLDRGERVLVHCSAGLGRTGLFLTCLTRRLTGLDAQGAKDALEKARVPLLLTPWQRSVAEAYVPEDPRHEGASARWADDGGVSEE